MSKAWLCGGVLVVLLWGQMSLVSAPPCGGATQCFCGYTLVSSYDMTYDLTNCAGVGLWIGASNITLNCNGRIIDGANSTLWGIVDAPFSGPLVKNGITIKNCIVREFNDGISPSYMSNSTFANNSVYNNTDVGIALGFSFFNVNNLVTNNTIKYNFIGLGVWDDNNILIGNTVANNHYWGIYTLSANNTLIMNNTVLNNAYTGIDVLGDNNVLIGNSVIGNLNDGIYISGDRHRVLGNVVRQNVRYGINLHGAMSSNVTGNLVTSNAVGIDLNLSSQNFITNNNFSDNALNANEEGNTANNSWNASGVGNYWSDFASNPGYPDEYRIPGPGDGVDYFPVGGRQLRCGDTVTQDTRLKASLLDCLGDGLIFGADNIMLDCNGHTIDGVNAIPSYGIRTNFHAGVSITNCVVQEFYMGAYVGGGQGNTETANTFQRNNYGIHIYGSDDNRLEDNIIRDNFWDGIWAWSTLRGRLINNSVRNNSGGIHVLSSFLTTLEDNRIQNNAQAGVFLDWASENSLANNTVSSNSLGLRLLYAPRNNISGNLISANSQFGLLLEPASTQNLLYANTLEANGINAYENLTSMNNHWNRSEVGNSWSDFAANPGYPSHYEVPGPGDGVDYHPVGAASMKYPILYVHGYCGSPRPSEPLLVQLVNEGYDVSLLDYAPGTCFPPFVGPACANGDIKSYGPALKAKLAEIRARTAAAQVDILAHSMGGLVSRWYIESPDYAGDVHQLIMLGTPNHGSAWANLEWLMPEFDPSFLDITEPILCVGTGEAVDQMKPKSSFLAKLNYGENEFNWAKWQTDSEALNPAVPYQVLAGTNWSRLGIKTRIFKKTAKSFFNRDGIHAGFTRNGDMLVAVYGARLLNPATGCDEFGSTHGGLTDDPEPIAKVLQYLRFNAPKADNCTYEDKVPRTSKASTAEPGVAFSPLQSGTLAQGETRPHTILVDSTVQTALFGLVWENESANLSLSLIAPNGTRYNASSPEASNATTRRHLGIEAPAAGTWTLLAFGDTVAGTEGYQTRASFETPLVLDIVSASENYSVPPGQPFEIEAYVTDGTAIVTGTAMGATIRRPDGAEEVLPLYDDNLDGVFFNTYLPPVLGAYEVRVTALGVYNAQSFERQDETTFWAEVFPDLMPTAFWSEPWKLVAGQPTVLKANTTNAGTGTAMDSEIRFFDGLPSNGTLIGTQRLNVSANQTATASAPWTPTYGSHALYVSVSPFNAFLELDYGNNERNRSVFVGLAPRRGGSPVFARKEVAP